MTFRPERKTDIYRVNRNLWLKLSASLGTVYVERNISNHKFEITLYSPMIGLPGENIKVVQPNKQSTITKVFTSDFDLQKIKMEKLRNNYCSMCIKKITNYLSYTDDKSIIHKNKSCLEKCDSSIDG